jgi:hypothetical protein
VRVFCEIWVTVTAFCDFFRMLFVTSFDSILRLLYIESFL